MFQDYLFKLKKKKLNKNIVEIYIPVELVTFYNFFTMLIVGTLTKVSMSDSESPS